MTFHIHHPRYILHIPPRSQADWRWLEYVAGIAYTAWETVEKKLCEVMGV